MTLTNIRESKTYSSIQNEEYKTDIYKSGTNGIEEDKAHTSTIVTKISCRTVKNEELFGHEDTDQDIRLTSIMDAHTFKYNTFHNCCTLLYRKTFIRGTGKNNNN